jgi:hypothetical protein
MQIALAVISTVFGLALLLGLFRLLAGLKTQLAKLNTEAPPVERFSAEGPITVDGVLYLYAHDFVKPAPRRPVGSIPRDRAFACQTGDELDCDDFAKQLLYATLIELHTQHCLETRVVKREASYMPPYPHKQWELQLRQVRPFPSSPLCDSLGVGFELSAKNRLRLLRGRTELEASEQFFALEEVLERGLKAIRQELSFWERGSVCSDLRGYVQGALVAQGFLLEPDRDNWLDTVRAKRPLCNQAATTSVEPAARALERKLEAFRKRHGSPHALNPEKDEKGQVVDIDPAVLNASEEFDAMPLDDVLRATIHEAIVAIKQLEPSGEAGI